MKPRSAMRAGLTAAAAAAALLTGLAPASAQDADDLERRVAELEAMLAELRAEVDAARAEADAARSESSEVLQTARAEPAAAPEPEEPRDGFQMGGTRVSYGGFVDLDAHVSDYSDGALASNSIGRDFYIPGLIPVGGEGPEQAQLDAVAESSRFFLATETDTAAGPVTGRIEMDFLSSPGGDERVTNSFNPRLRVAWAEFGNWRVGQDWSTFQNLAVIPESASFLTLSDGMIFMRQPLVRYTNGGFQVALENPETTVTPFEGGARIDSDAGFTPDFVARYNMSGDWGGVALLGLARSLTYDEAGMDSNAFGWALSVQGSYNVGQAGKIQYSLTGGEGVGRYIGLNAVNAAVLDANGELEAIPTWGGLVAYQHEIAEGRRFNIGYSYLAADNDVALTGSGATANVYSGFASYMVDIMPGVSVGGEIMFGERELENGETGSLTRATVSTRYTF